MADEKTRLRGNEIGPTGEAVAQNLKRHRAGVSLRELQERLKAGGREISASGLQKIEAGVRRVDVDDLMALALALGVSPLALLLPQGEQADTSHVGGRELRNDELWQWAVGHVPLGNANPRQFRANSLPHWLLLETRTETLGRDPIPAKEFWDWWKADPNNGNG